MANNKKKSSKSKADKAPTTEPAPEAPMVGPAAPPHSIENKGVFLTSQFTTLILLVMGAVRLMNVRSMSLSPTKCLGYLGETACQDPIVTSLLGLKFQCAIPVWIMVFLYMLLAWNTESMLAQINGLMVLSPLMAGMAVLLGNAEVISYSVAKGQCVIAIVLVLLALPQKDQPFSGDRVGDWKTIPSIALATMAIVAMIQAVNCVLDSYDVDGMVIAELLPWPEHLVAFQPAVRPILQFFAMDYLLMGLLYAYAWYSFPDSTQRALLIRLTAVKVGEAFYQLPMFEESYEMGVWQSMAIGSAILCGAAYASPRNIF